MEHTVFSTQYDDVLKAAPKNRRDVDYLFDTAPFKALSNDVDEAMTEKPGGGALDDDEDPETNNRSGGALPISGGGEAEALPEAVATVIAKTGATEDEKTKMDTFVAL